MASVKSRDQQPIVAAASNRQHSSLQPASPLQVFTCHTQCHLSPSRGGDIPASTPAEAGARDVGWLPEAVSRVLATAAPHVASCASLMHLISVWMVVVIADETACHTCRRITPPNCGCWLKLFSVPCTYRLPRSMVACLLYSCFCSVFPAFPTILTSAVYNGMRKNSTIRQMYGPILISIRPCSLSMVTRL